MSKPRNRHRTVPPVLDCPVHSGGVKASIVMVNQAVHTIELPEGHFAALVLDRPGLHTAAVAIMDRADIEATIALLQNAIDDADRLDRGLSAIHAPPTETRQ